MGIGINKFDFTLSIDSLEKYPSIPFNPNFNYPEFDGTFKQFDTSNNIYKNVRDLFINSGYDKVNVGTSRWNPFRGLIKDGQIAVIKPNFVYEETNEILGKECLITHVSLIRPVIDYLYLLQIKDKIKFRIIVTDVPIQGANFNKILEQSGLKALQEFYINHFSFNFEILDLRHKIAIDEGNGFFKTINNSGDPLGYSKIHLKNSFLQEIANDYKKFGAPGYGINETFSQIKETGNHYYHIPNTILQSDLFVNMPKIKTHKKAGITVAMKNLIGINGEKAWIPHFRRGSIKTGGDEFDDKQVFLKTITTRANVLLQGRSRLLWNLGKKINKYFFKIFFRKDLRPSLKLSGLEQKALFLVNGDWYGNDTLWRPILDLNYLLFYVNKKGEEVSSKVRNYICLSDGVIAGEGDGPVNPSQKKAGIIALSQNPILNDICISRIMGFDWEKIPQLRNSTFLKEYFEFDRNFEKFSLLENINSTGYNVVTFEELPNLKFNPPPGWLNQIEIMVTR
jgi:uncharacterized protein (DUF362 family)